MTYGRAFWVGLTNTLLVAVIGIFFATILGFLIGIARLSSNWLVARLATVYVEVVRHIPLLLQLFIWYIAFSRPVPDVFKTDAAGGYITTRRQAGRRQPRSRLGILLNRRGYISWPGVAGRQPFYPLCVRARRCGIDPHLDLGTPAAAPDRSAISDIAGVTRTRPPAADRSVCGTGGCRDIRLPNAWALQPERRTGGAAELVALLLGLVIYTAAFIAEIVRAAFSAFPKGRRRPHARLACHRPNRCDLLCCPKRCDSSSPADEQLSQSDEELLAAGGNRLSDLVSVFAGTVLNQTNQAVETIFITMMIYLTLSLLTSAFMNCSTGAWRWSRGNRPCSRTQQFSSLRPPCHHLATWWGQSPGFGPICFRPGPIAF